MGDHSHHHHHNMDHSNHMMENTSTTTESLLGTIPSTTAATILQAVMTTMMSHDAHHLHRSPVESQHAGHSFHSDQMAADSSAGSDVHATHLGSGGDHMQMYFHFGVDTVILFKEWTTSSTESIIGSVIGIFILAMIYEGIKFFREFLFKKYFTSLEYSSVSVLGDDGKPVTEVHKVASNLYFFRNRMLSWPHMIQTFLHVVQMILSYFLMLIFMTFNVWLCLGVILGSGVGYFLFGWRKATVVDITEHCH